MKLPSIQKLCHNILFLTIFAIESFLIASLNFFPDYRQFSRISRFFLVFTHMNEIPAVLAALDVTAGACSNSMRELLSNNRRKIY